MKTIGMKYLLIILMAFLMGCGQQRFEYATLTVTARPDAEAPNYVRYQWLTPNKEVHLTKADGNGDIIKAAQSDDMIPLKMVNHFAKSGWRFMNEVNSPMPGNKALTVKEFWFERKK